MASGSKKLKFEDRALAIGMGHNEEDPLFVFNKAMLMEVLKPIDIVIKQLKSSGEYLIPASGVIKCVQDDINHGVRT